MTAAEKVAMEAMLQEVGSGAARVTASKMQKAAEVDRREASAALMSKVEVWDASRENIPLNTR